jgi:CDP-glycerol glycerophosphotransferase (TagB/SpsB family)
LLDKPLAFVVPDIEDYKQNRGFCFDNPEDYMPGPIIKEKKELYNFFDILDKNDDQFENERYRVKNLIFKFQDGKNIKRVLKISDISK